MKIVTLVQDKIQNDIKANVTESSTQMLGWVKSMFAEAAQQSLFSDNFSAEITVGGYNSGNGREYTKAVATDHIHPEGGAYRAIAEMVVQKREEKIRRDFAAGVLLSLIDNYYADDLNACTSVQIAKARPAYDASHKSLYYKNSRITKAQGGGMSFFTDQPVIESTASLAHTTVGDKEPEQRTEKIDWDSLTKQLHESNFSYWSGIASMPTQYDADLAALEAREMAQLEHWASDQIATAIAAPAVSALQWGEITASAITPMKVADYGSRNIWICT